MVNENNNSELVSVTCESCHDSLLIHQDVAYQYDKEGKDIRCEDCERAINN